MFGYLAFTTTTTTTTTTTITTTIRPTTTRPTRTGSLPLFDQTFVTKKKVRKRIALKKSDLYMIDTFL